MSRENNRKRFLVVVVKTVVKSDFEPVLRNAGKGNMLVPQHVLGLLDRWSSVWIRSPKAPALPTGLYPDTRYKILPDVVKHVVKRILPQIPGTFKRGKLGYLRGFRAGSDIFGAVAETVSRLPNQARYQTSLSPDRNMHFKCSNGTLPQGLLPIRQANRGFAIAPQIRFLLYTIHRKKATKT